MSVNKRKCLSVREKVEIIRELERGEKNVEVCNKFHLSLSIASTLWKNKEAILSALENNLVTNKKMRKCDLGNVDQALLEWFKVPRNAGSPINGPILKVQAEKFAKQLGHENFTCNNRWLDHFKNWHNSVYAKVSGEALSVDLKTASEWVKSVWVECQQGYSEENIYNADETGVFYNMMPDSTFKFKAEKCVKNRLMILMCVNMTGTDKKGLCYWKITNTTLFKKRKEASR
jgi:hypothetical protein